MITQKSKRIINSFIESVTDSIEARQDYLSKVQSINRLVGDPYDPSGLFDLDCYENYSFEDQISYNFAWNMFNEVVVVFKDTGSLTAFLADVNIELVLDSQENYDNAVRETCRLIFERAGE